ncbi:hypothetical protein JH06_6038, partial [Blastocystis sp. subtype 4]|uniref:hypothetical protein n=1 Tax=Blastocystis sp. subtype 4 TaxID=944170 RepID=UPI0007122B83
TGVFLPDGLSLNEKTGEISGVPTSVQELTTYTVYAENESGATRTTVIIQVRKGQCVAEGVFPVTDVGKVAEYDCATQGSYVGTQKRSCVLGVTDGEWQKVSGLCMSIPILVLILFVVIVIIAVVVLFLMRNGKKAKVVGGMKGKKSSKSSKTTAKKVSAKQAKV